jgi:hypothetical protein
VGKGPRSLIAGSGRGARHSRPSPRSLLSGPAHFGEIAVGGLLSSSPGSGHPRWNRQPATSAVGPLGGAGLLIFTSWRFLDASRQIARPVACPISHPHDNSGTSSPPRSSYRCKENSLRIVDLEGRLSLMKCQAKIAVDKANKSCGFIKTDIRA